MALALADRVQETSTTTGTGTLTLAGAVLGYQSFAVIGNGNTTYYTITNAAGDWEVGIGTYTSAGTTLSRTTVLSSSNAGSLVSFTGTLNVFVTYPAGKSVNLNESGVVTGYPITVLDSVFTLQDNLDTSKQAQFQLGSITTATTRAYTLPNVDTVLAGLAVSQTFSNTNVFSNGTNTFGSATGTGTNGFSSGATTTGNTKTVNIGTGGLTGSTTAITMGAVAGTSTTTMNGQTDIGGTTTSVNFARVVGAITGAAPIISAQGSDASVNLSIRGKSAGVVGIGADTIAGASLVVAPVASSINYTQISGNTVGFGPIIAAQGIDANIAFTLRSKGTFGVTFQSSAGSNIAEFLPTFLGFGVNFSRFTNAIAGSAPEFSAQGSDADISLRLTPKGTGGVWFTGPLLPNNLAGTSGQVLTSAGAGAVPTWTTASTGTVTSVAMTVPTGLSIAGTPITTSGTLALTLTAGYSIPTTASQTNWDSAYTQRLQWDGGATNLVAATGRTSLGATTVGGNFFTLTNPTAITFPRINADNTVSALDAATFRTAIGAGTSSTTGTVTSVAATVPAFLSVTGSPVTTSGTLAISYSGTALPVANGGTGLTTLTANYIPYGNGTSAFQSYSGLNFASVTNSPANMLYSTGGMSIGTGGISYPTQATGTGYESKGGTSNGRFMVQDGNGRLNQYWNAYTDAGGYKYIVTGEPAVRYLQTAYGSTGGQHGFYGAPSGTAGTALAWTQVGQLISATEIWFSPRGTSSDFYINASGNVGIGTTSPTSALTISTSGSTASLSITDTGGSGAGFGLLGNGATTPNKYIRAAGGVLQVLSSAYSVIFQISDAGVIQTGSWNGSTIGAAYGGTGVTTLTGLAYGNGTSAFTAATAAQIVAAIGATAVTNATNATNVTGTVAVANGGTGLTSVTVNRLLYGNGTSALQNSANFTYNGTTQNITASGASTVLTLNSSGSTASLTITDTGAAGAGIGMFGNGATTPNKYFRVLSGNYEVVNNAYNAVIYRLSDAGAISSCTWNGATIGVAYGGTGLTSVGTTGNVLTSNGSAWVSSALDSNITTKGLYENNATISANYTIATGNNAMSAGPITINSGIVVTVPSGSTWVVV